MFTRSRNRATLISALAGAALCAALATGTATAQSTEAPKKDDPSQTLKGPDVQDRDVPGSSSTFGDPQMDPAKGKERPVPHMMFMAALRTLTRDDAPADLRATQEQIEQVKALDQEFRDARRAYMEEHRGEIRELMQQIHPDGAPGPRGPRTDDDDRPPRDQPGRPGRRGAPGQRPPRGEPGDGPRPRIDPSTLNDEQRAAFEKLRQIRAAGPSVQECHATIWAVLSPEQQAYVKGHLAEMRERAADDMRDARRRPPRDAQPGPPRNDQRPRRPRGDRPQRTPDPRERAEFWRPGPGAPPQAPFSPGPGPGAPPRAGFGPHPAGPPGPPFARFDAPRAPGFEPGPDAPRMDHLAARLEALPPEVRSRVLDRLEAVLDRLEKRFERPAPPPIDDLPIPE